MNERIIAIVGDVAGKPVGLGTQFDKLMIDSLDFLQMIQDVENVIGAKISDQQIIKINTVGDLMAIAEELYVCQ